LVNENVRVIISLPTKRISLISQWKNIYQGFTHKMAAKASWHWNYLTVTLCLLDGALEALRLRAALARDWRWWHRHPRPPQFSVELGGVCVCDRAAGSDDGDAGGAGRWYNQSRPTFKPTPTNVSVALGQTAVLRCSVDNLRDRTVSLYVSISAFVLSLWAVVGTLVHDQG